MSTVISMPGMRKRLDLVHWAEKQGIFSEKDGHIICKCAKCVHSSTTKPLDIVLGSNRNVENTCFQHLWGSDNVQLTKDGNPFIDMTRKWCPHHHWHRDAYEHLSYSASTGKCYSSQEQMEKAEAEASQVQMPDEDSHSSSGAAVVPDGAAVVPAGASVVPAPTDAKKPTYLAAATSNPNAVTNRNTITVDKVPQDGRKIEDTVKYPKMHFGPIITSDQLSNGQITSEVNFIPMFCETEDDIYSITPCDTLDYYYTSAVTPYVEDTRTWYCPCVVYEAAGGGMKKKISYTPKVKMNPDGLGYMYI